MSTRKQLFKKIYIVFIVLLLIVFSEVFLRVFYYEQLKTRITSTNRIPDSNFVYIRKPKTIERYCTPGVDNTFFSNNNGYTGPDFDTQKDSGVYRIIFIGNSNVEGMHMNGKNNFTVILQTLFDKFYPNVQVEIINCAKEGARKDFQHLKQIKQELLKYNPDLILLENSGEFSYKRYVFEGYRNYTLEYDPKINTTRQECIEIVDNLYKYRLLTIIYDASFVVRAICKKYIESNSNWNEYIFYKTNSKFEKYLYSYIRKDVKALTAEYQVSGSFFLDQYHEIIAKMNNGKLVVFNFGQYNNIQRQFFFENKIKFIELRFNNYQYLPLNSKMEGHFNESAHALIAERFFSMLIYNELIPKKLNYDNIK